jgi:hypothetical protein
LHIGTGHQRDGGGVIIIGGGGNITGVQHTAGQNGGARAANFDSASGIAVIQAVCRDCAAIDQGMRIAETLRQLEAVSSAIAAIIGGVDKPLDHAAISAAIHDQSWRVPEACYRA